MKLLIRQMARAISYKDVTNANKPPVIYNGQTRGQSCLPNPGRKARSLFRRQADACPLPSTPGGGIEGPRVSFRPGRPAPTCTANCGKLCTGFYCSAHPTGTPPDFTTTLDPGPTGPFPTLPPDPTESFPPGETCLSSATTVVCNIGACATSTTCASTGTPPPLPTLEPTLDPSPSGAVCVSSTTWTFRGGPKFEATMTSSGCATWSIPTPDPTPSGGGGGGGGGPDPRKPKGSYQLWTSDTTIPNFPADPIEIYELSGFEIGEGASFDPCE